MSHATKVTAPGWAHAVLIHDGGMTGRIEVRGWYPKQGRPDESIAYFDHEPDFAAKLDDGHVEILLSADHPEDPRASVVHERDLIYRAGQVVGAARLEGEITRVLESRKT